MLDRKQKNKVERLVELVCAIDDIDKDDTDRVNEVRKLMAEIIKNEREI